MTSEAGPSGGAENAASPTTPGSPTADGTEAEMLLHAEAASSADDAAVDADADPAAASAAAAAAAADADADASAAAAAAAASDADEGGAGLDARPSTPPYAETQPKGSEPQRVLSQQSQQSVESWDMKKHASSAFKQQRLPAWSPVLSPSSVLPFFLVVGALLIPAGVGLLFLSESVREYRVVYTYCPQYFEENGTYGSRNCADVIADTRDTCHCLYNFSLPNNVKDPVFLYYQLTRYHQNHRRYVNSRDDYQLLGHLYDRVASKCAPFDYDDRGRPIAPCGAVADSLFNDSLRLRLLSLSHAEGPPLPLDVPLLRTGIAWPTDKKFRFGNPPGNLTAALAGFAKPRSWKRHVYELDPEDEDNNGFMNEDLIVWMRTAGLPSFRKLYRRVEHLRKPFKEGLPAGNYSLFIEYNYPVAPFRGDKTFIATSTTAIGVGNRFLGAAYVSAGAACLLLGALFLALHLRYRQATALMVSVEPHTPYL